MKQRFILTLASLLAGIWCVNAQVVIGSNDEPQQFAVLELISKGNSGLRLPQLTTSQRDIMTATAQFAAVETTTARGLLIFNMSKNCVEFWNGSKWIEFIENK